jgi:hypothetical protein
MLTKLAVLGFAVIGTLEAPAPVEFRQQLAQFGQRCVTPRGACFTGALLPLGSRCFCPTPVGPVEGKVG